MANRKSPISKLQSLISKGTLAVLFLLAFPFVYFWQVTLGQSVWLTTDILRLFYPFSVELARALNEGRLPLWTPNLLAGFPLLAESQIGALYPVNWLLYKLLPPHYALSFNILLHIAWAGCGMYVFTRARGIGVAGAWLASFVFAFNGVVLGQMFHPPILFAIAWLPWLLFLVARFQTRLVAGDSSPLPSAKARTASPTEKFCGVSDFQSLEDFGSLGALNPARLNCSGTTSVTTRRAIWFALAALALGVQFLCGSIQMAFLNALAVAVFGGIQSSVVCRQSTVRRSLFVTFLLLALGGGIAAIQLLPTNELIGYSVRGGALGKEFVTSYSLPPEYLAQFVFPFAPGEPAEGNEEYRAYFGIAPLLLALAALILKRDRQTIFFAALGLAALSLALGELNPLYQLLYRLPLFNFFRVPARYLYLFVFTMAFLSAVGFDRVIARSDFRDEAMTPRALAFFMFVLLTLGALALTHTQSLAFWLDAWRALPIALIVATLGALALAWTRKITRGAFVIAILGVTMFDLTSHAPPFLKTIDALTPTTGITVPPRSAQALGDALTRGRTWTDDSLFPSPPAIRNSLFPNTALLYDKPSAQIYSSLAFGRHQAYVYNMSPAMRDLLGVRFVMLPLEPRPPRALPADALGTAITRDEIVFDPIQARALEIVSATEQADDFADGTLVAEIVLRFADGATQVLPLRAGIETADWDVARKQFSPRVPIARTFPAYWRAFGRAFTGQIYRARYEFASPRAIVGARVRVLEPAARLLIESIALETPTQTISLARWIGTTDFALAYFSDTVAAWENRDALPRAFIVSCVRALDDGAAFARMRALEFDPTREVLLADAPFAGAQFNCAPTGAVEITTYKPERVEMRATTDQPGYLVLADSWYPGWEARVDGQVAPIHRANVIFRAVRIESGTHAIIFEYRPWSFALGALISAVSLLIVGGILILELRKTS